MNEVATQEVTNQPAAEIPQGTKAPAPGAVSGAVMEQLHKDEQTIAQLNARILVLEKNQKQATEKKPVSDADLAKAISALQAKNAASLKQDSPKLDLSLSGQLGFVPILSAGQKETWAPARDAMRNAHTQAWKAKSAVVIAHLKRAVRMPQAVMSGGITQRKSDKAVTGVSLRARNLAKPTAVKGKGKKAAKPAQVAAKMPAAPNANPPATVK